MSAIPDEVIQEFEDGLWRKIVDSDEWIDLGIAPRPKNVWQGLLHHICHGILMQYNIFLIIGFSWKHRKSFIDQPVVEILDGNKG